MEEDETTHQHFYCKNCSKFCGCLYNNPGETVERDFCSDNCEDMYNKTREEKEQKRE